MRRRINCGRKRRPDLDGRRDSGGGTPHRRRVARRENLRVVWPSRAQYSGGEPHCCPPARTNPMSTRADRPGSVYRIASCSGPQRCNSALLARYRMHRDPPAFETVEVLHEYSRRRSCNTPQPPRPSSSPAAWAELAANYRHGWLAASFPLLDKPASATGGPQRRGPRPRAFVSPLSPCSRRRSDCSS